MSRRKNENIKKIIDYKNCVLGAMNKFFGSFWQKTGQFFLFLSNHHRTQAEQTFYSALRLHSQLTNPEDNTGKNRSTGGGDYI